MTDEQPGRELSRLIGANTQSWQEQFSFFGEQAPGHQMISQILAVGVDAADIVYVQGSINPKRDLADFSADLLIISTRHLIECHSAAGAEPTTFIRPRAALQGIRVLSAPIATYSVLGSAHHPLEIELTYPWGQYTLPGDRWSSKAEEMLAVALHSFIDDLATPSP